MVQRGGFDVIDCVWLEEATFGTTPTTAALVWTPVWLLNLFNARKRSIIQEAIGLGRQLPKEFHKVKEFGELSIEHQLLKEETTPTTFKWSDFYQNLVADGSWTVGNHIPSFSLSSKMDLTTDEFWVAKGCKINRYEVRGDSIEDLIKGRAGIQAQFIDYATTDIVGGDQTRTGNPVSDSLIFGDADILYGLVTPVTLYDRLSRWAFVFEREIERRGTDATTPTLYAAFPEKRRKYTVELTLDFDSRTELEHMLDDEEMKVTLKIPNETDGKQFALTGGKWLEHEIPEREIDLIDLTLRGEFTALAITDIT